MKVYTLILETTDYTSGISSTDQYILDVCSSSSVAEERKTFHKFNFNKLSKLNQSFNKKRQALGDLASKKGFGCSIKNWKDTNMITDWNNNREELNEAIEELLPENAKGAFIAIMAVLDDTENGYNDFEIKYTIQENEIIYPYISVN